MPAKSPKTTGAKAAAATSKVSKSKASTTKASKAPATAKKAATGTARKKRPVKASSKLTPSFTLDPKKPVKEPVIKHDDIALRAYFIAELRQKMGWPGDSATDWADAEKQLRAEAIEKPLKKR